MRRLGRLQNAHGRGVTGPISGQHGVWGARSLVRAFLPCRLGRKCGAARRRARWIRAQRDWCCHCASVPRHARTPCHGVTQIISARGAVGQQARRSRRDTLRDCRRRRHETSRERDKQGDNLAIGDPGNPPTPPALGAATPLAFAVGGKAGGGAHGLNPSSRLDSQLRHISRRPVSNDRTCGSGILTAGAIHYSSGGLAG